MENVRYSFLNALPAEVSFMFGDDNLLYNARYLKKYEAVTITEVRAREEEQGGGGNV